MKAPRKPALWQPTNAEVEAVASTLKGDVDRQALRTGLSSIHLMCQATPADGAKWAAEQIASVRKLDTALERASKTAESIDEVFASGVGFDLSTLIDSIGNTRVAIELYEERLATGKAVHPPKFAARQSWSRETALSMACELYEKLSGKPAPVTKNPEIPLHRFTAAVLSVIGMGHTHGSGLIDATSRIAKGRKKMRAHKEGGKSPKVKRKAAP